MCDLKSGEALSCPAAESEHDWCPQWQCLHLSAMPRSRGGMFVAPWCFPLGAPLQVRFSSIETSVPQSTMEGLKTFLMGCPGNLPIMHDTAARGMCILKCSNLIASKRGEHHLLAR